MMEGLTLVSLLDSLLLPAGFRRPPRSATYAREAGGVRQVVGLRKSRSGGKQCAVYFSSEAAPAAPAETFELSPVAPLKNTYWWPAELSDEEASALRRQIEGVALAYFRADAAHFDEETAQTSAHAALGALTAAKPPFVRVGDSYWRRRGGLFDVVDVEFLARSRFAFIYVCVWHETLESGAVPQGPDEISRVTSRTVGRGAIDAEPNTTLFFLGPGDELAAAVEQAEIVATCLAFFQTIVSSDDVLGQIRPEYRQFFPPAGYAG
jgi:hypothetical protein